MYWSAGEISEAKLRNIVPWLNEDFKIKITYSNGGGVSRFSVSISHKKGRMTVNMSEQIGCCGYGNINQPWMESGTVWVAKRGNGDLFLEVVEAMAGLVCASGIQFVGTNKEWLFKAMKTKKHNWTLVHKMPNRRYSQRGSMLWIWCKNFNTFKGSKPVYPRRKGSLYGY
jgi:hypothetical protein